MSKAIRQDDLAQKPLSGRRIVVTRARAQAESLARRIEELGGEVIEFPTIEIRPPESFVAFDAAVERIDSYDWLIFTSVNSVEPFLARLQQKGKTVASLEALKIGAIGPETAKRLEDAEIRVCLVPERYQAEGLLDPSQRPKPGSTEMREGKVRSNEAPWPLGFAVASLR